MENHPQFKTKQQIAHELNTSYSTFRRRMKEAGLDIPRERVLAPAQYTPIYTFFKNGAKLKR